MKECIVCGTQFQPKRKNSVCCSEECKDIRQKQLIESARVEKLAAKYSDVDAYEYTECAICGVRGADITKHVMMEHGMSSQEYRNKFGITTKCQRLVDNVSGENNPGYQHGGKLSPFSKKFVSYDGLSDTEKQDKISSMGVQTQITAKENNNSQLHHTVARKPNDL